VTRRPPIKRLARSAGLLLALYPAPAPNSEEAFDHAVLIEDFEYPICQFCMGTGWVRDENGIHMVTCDNCEGKGRAPTPE